MRNNNFDRDRSRDVPVYFICGFLESGKTSFVQETLADPEFDTGMRTLVILCEDGEVECDPSVMRRSPVELRRLEDAERLTSTLLSEWDRRFRPDRVMVEYNGMWMKEKFYAAMPQDWVIQQEFFFAEGGSFMSCNANMRSLVFDKIKGCDLVVFNRFDQSQDVMPYHKIVRAINRGCTIIYEGRDGSLRYDEIQDPLPFDKQAPVIHIQDRDYAFWYQDLNEEMKSYQGKTVRFKARVALPSDLKAGEFVAGRHMMNCCAADISFAGLIAEGNSTPIQNGEWVELTAGITLKRHRAYGTVGPVLTVKSVEPASPPEEEVATFY